MRLECGRWDCRIRESQPLEIRLADVLDGISTPLPRSKMRLHVSFQGL